MPGVQHLKAGVILIAADGGPNPLGLWRPCLKPRVWRHQDNDSSRLHLQRSEGLEVKEPQRPPR